MVSQKEGGVSGRVSVGNFFFWGLLFFFKAEMPTKVVWGN